LEQDGTFSRDNTCVPCEPGNYCIAGLQTPCALGLNSEGNGATQCLACPYNYFAPTAQDWKKTSVSNGGMLVLSLDPTTWQDIVGCKSCTMGNDCRGGLNVPCVPGEFNDEDGSDSLCELMPAGMQGWIYGDQGRTFDALGYPLGLSHSVRCVDTELAQPWVDEQGTIHWTLEEDYHFGYSYTDAGSITYSRGCPLCPAGSWCSKGIRQDCAAGTYSVQATTFSADDMMNRLFKHDPCVSCHNGTISQTGAAQCTVCGGGTFSQNNVCEACEKDHKCTQVSPQSQGITRNYDG
jgi:hypothetical protein